MAGNGKRKPPRPRIAAPVPTPDPDEAAALVAALERFIADTAPAPQPSSSQSPWQRAALREGVEAKRGAYPPSSLDPR